MDEKPPIDLHPSEWTRGRKLKQPILTPHGRTFLIHFAILLFVGMAMSAVLTRLFDGEFPYWLQPFLG